jgi:hypothetical protein
MRTRPVLVLLVAALLLASIAGTASARKPAAKTSTTTIVSTGSGRQVLEGGGLTYGTLAPGGDVRVIDLSPKHDGKFTVTAQVPATDGAAAQSLAVKPVRLGGGLLYFKLRPLKQNAGRNLAFSVAGSKFRLVLEGDSALNGAGVTGKIALDGTGTISVNGQTPALEWASAPRITLAPRAALPATAKAPARTTTTATAPATTTATTSTSP